MRSRLMLAVVAALLAVILAGCGDMAEPPWEVRTYLSPSTDATYTWNMSVVRKKWVDPDSGYSTDQEDPDPGNPLTYWYSPDPYGAHAGVDVELVPGTSQERIMGALTCVGNPLIGRPFHPGAATYPGGATEPDWDAAQSPWTNPVNADVSSYVHVRAAGLASSYYEDDAPGVGYLIDTAATSPTGTPDKGRFLVVQPGAVRAAASVPSATKQVVATQGHGSPTPGNWTIHVNPYRVSDGDEWYIRQHEATDAAGATTELSIEVYSKLYGADFSLNSAPDGAVDLVDFGNENGCAIITNSGALRILCARVLTGATESGTWVMGFTIASNTQTLPCPEEMDYDDIGGVDLYAGRDEPTPARFNADINLAFVAKSPWMLVVDGGLDGYLTTSDDAMPVVEKATNGNFNHDACWPYRIPPGAVGLGHVLVQWRDGTPNVLRRRNDTSDTYFRGGPPPLPGEFEKSGGEWFYHVDLYRQDPANEHPAFNAVKVLNFDIAEGRNIGDDPDFPAPIGPLTGDPEHYQFVDCQFMSTRVDVPLTEDEWVRSSDTNEGDIEPDQDLASGGYTTVIVGEGADPTTEPSPVGGEYNPGSSTPQRPFHAANRMSALTVVCPIKSGGCGTHFLDRVGTGDPDDPVAGDPCPVCGRTLVAEPGEAELHYDAIQPPTVLSDGDRHSIPPESIGFGPSNNKVPIGSSDFLQTVGVDIPRYQPPSVPRTAASAFENYIDNDPGYVGIMVAYHRAAEVAAPDIVDTNYNWDVYYQSPNNGYKQPVPGNHNGPGPHAREERYCPVCDARFSTVPPVPGNCPFCGAALQDAPGAQVPESCLMCEEFDAFDLQVSVNRKVELASDQRTVDLGWVAPGVPDDQPNTATDSTQPMAAGSEPRPVDVSRRSDFVVRNEGNIPTPTYMRAGYLFRPEIDSALRSWARNGQSVPGTVGTLYRFVPAAAGDVAFPAGWTLERQEATGAAGMDATARLQAGIRADPAYPSPDDEEKPVPLGQPAGNYTGEVLVFVDLDGDGQLGFIDSEVGSTTTATTEFNPDVDEPYEPVAAFSSRMRVVESRLPHSDMYSRDVTPTGTFDAGLDNLQVVWSGNRPSAQGADPTAQDEADAGTQASDVPAANDPFNVLYANADMQVFSTAGPTYDPLYRGWLWERDAATDDLVEAKALSGSSTTGLVNSAPVSYLDEGAAGNDRWVMWHRRITTSTGVDAQLRFDSSANDEWTGSSASEFIYGSDPARFGLTGFAREHSAVPADPAVHWLFWHTGPKGRESIRYRWNFDPTAAVVTSNEGPLPVSNAVAAGKRSDVWYLGGGLGHKKPSHSPFTYVKDPCAFEQLVSGAPYVHVFFAGHVRAAGNSDICWVKFYEPMMVDPDANYGKEPFARVADNEYMPAVAWLGGNPIAWAGEELASDARRHNFSTRHLDWLVSDDTQDGDADDTNFATAPNVATYDDPQFYLGVVRDSAGALVEDRYTISWSDGRYGRSSGSYLVTPVLTGLHATAPPPLPAGVEHPTRAGELLDPHVRVEGPDPQGPSVRMRMDPAAGTIRWSAALFNADNPADPLAVFNTSNTPGLVDVVMYADYTPYIMRITTDEANDDSPSAFYDLGESSRLTVFWRRSYSSTDTPHFGRTDFMHKTWTTALQVARPPIAGITAITDITPSPNQPVGAANYTVDGRNGIITLTELRRIGHVIRVDYTSATSAGAQTEYHRIIGWSKETPVPVDTVVSEGKLDVIPETYAIPDGLGGAGTVDLVRYWLFWSSPRATYDVRAAGNDGQQVHQSSDVYCAVVAPEYGSLIRQADVPRIGP